MNSSVEIYYTCVAVRNPSAKLAINGIVLIYEHHLDSANPKIEDTELEGFTNALNEIFSL